MGKIDRMSDLFNAPTAKAEYSAKDIEVLEGLEPVRKRPGMYIGGIDERAYHHLVAEIIDNAMDEAVAGYATHIEVNLSASGYVTVKDNGRGIPVDPHPKFPGKSALEVITTTLHSGGKFGGGAYAVSGGLHGVGLSAVNALSSHMIIEVAKDKKLYRQEYHQGHPVAPVECLGAVSNRRGTSVSFIPDTEIFGESVKFKPATLFRMTRTKAFLFRGVEVRWSCAPELIQGEDKTPVEQILKFPNGVADYLDFLTKDRQMSTLKPFSGRVEFPDNQGAVEWAICWPNDFGESFEYSYCNTVPTPLGGTHTTGMKTCLTKGIKAFADMVGNKRAADITSDDILNTAGHHIYSSKNLFSVIDFGEEYRFSPSSKDYQKKDYLTLDFSTLKLPLLLKGQLSDNKSQLYNTQNAQFSFKIDTPINNSKFILYYL